MSLYFVGLALAFLFQTECHSLIRPTVGRSYGEFEGYLGYLFTYSLPVWRECAFFAVVLLGVAAFVPKKYSAAAKGIATCGLLNALLFAFALRFAA